MPAWQLKTGRWTALGVDSEWPFEFKKDDEADARPYIEKRSMTNIGLGSASHRTPRPRESAVGNFWLTTAPAPLAHSKGCDNEEAAKGDAERRVTDFLVVRGALQVQATAFESSAPMDRVGVF